MTKTLFLFDPFYVHVVTELEVALYLGTAFLVGILIGFLLPRGKP